MASDHPALINHKLPENKNWLRADEVAAYLDISKSSVFRLIKTGDIPHKRFGHLVRILRSDILAFENGDGDGDQSSDHLNGDQHD
jgi:excisionase family DNA binding protein